MITTEQQRKAEAWGFYKLHPDERTWRIIRACHWMDANHSDPELVKSDATMKGIWNNDAKQ